MARASVSFDPWPLLPRQLARAENRPADEPARATFLAVAALAAVFLLLRWTVPDPALGQEVARLVTLWGCLGGLAVVTVLTMLLVGVAVATPIQPLRGPVKDLALAVFDHAVHLALVLTACGLLGMIVLHGTIPGPAAWFAGQALLLWGSHRARLHLAGHGAA